MQIVIYNALLRSNPLLMRILIVLWKCLFHDVLFIPNLNNIYVKFKGNAKSYALYQELFDIPYEHIYIDTSIYLKMIHHIKLECNLNIMPQSKPQSGSFKFTIENVNYFIRVSFHANEYGMEAMSLRLIQSNILFDINIPPLKSGLIVIGGRTCSGKTSLMYAILLSILNQNKTIITLEDPVEYRINGILQTDIRHMGYDEGIRSALRQNPDWICIGEIRDSASAMAAIRAAMTGHNVITTIHVNNNHPNSLINRFEELGCKYLMQVLNQFIYCYRSENIFHYDIATLEANNILIPLSVE